MFLFINYAMYLRTCDLVNSADLPLLEEDLRRRLRPRRPGRIVLTFQFGLNWANYAHDVGAIVGVIIGMEVSTAFFLLP